MARFFKKREEIKGLSPGSLVFVGNKKVENVRIRVIDYDGTQLREDELEQIAQGADFKQTNTVFQPTSTLQIDSLSVNGIALGKLNLDISGDESLKKFYLTSNLENDNFDSFEADGKLEIVDDHPGHLDRLSGQQRRTELRPPCGRNRRSVKAGTCRCRDAGRRTHPHSAHR